MMPLSTTDNHDASCHVASRQGRSGDAKSLRDLPRDTVHPQRMRLSSDARRDQGSTYWMGPVGWWDGWWLGELLCVDLGGVIAIISVSDSLRFSSVFSKGVLVLS